MSTCRSWNQSRRLWPTLYIFVKVTYNIIVQSISHIVWINITSLNFFSYIFYTYEIYNSHISCISIYLLLDVLNFLKMIVLERLNMFYLIPAYEMTLVISVYLAFLCLPLYFCLLCLLIQKSLCFSSFHFTGFTCSRNLFLVATPKEINFSPQPGRHINIHMTEKSPLNQYPSSVRCIIAPLPSILLCLGWCWLCLFTSLSLLRIGLVALSFFKSIYSAKAWYIDNRKWLN